MVAERGGNHPDGARLVRLVRGVNQHGTGRLFEDKGREVLGDLAKARGRHGHLVGGVGVGELGSEVVTR